MEYACTVWLPHTAKNIDVLERVFSLELLVGLLVVDGFLLHAAGKSSDDCLEELQWSPIHQHHVYFSICQVYDIYANRNSISFSDYFHSSTVHPMKILPASSSVNSYRYFYQQLLFVECNSI